jgi:hypothetical protein
MPYALQYREELPEPVQREMDDFVAHLRGFMYREHNQDGTHHFGLPTNGHSGESSQGLSPINTSSQNFINSLSPGFVQMTELAITSGEIDAALLAAMNNLISTGVLNGGVLQVASRSFTEAEIESLNTPIELIPAPAVSTDTHSPVLLTMTVAVTTAYSTNPTLTLRYDGGTTALVTATAIGLNAIATRRYVVVPVDTNLVRATFDTRGKSVKAFLSANPGTPGTGVATMRLSAFYVTTSNG